MDIYDRFRQSAFDDEEATSDYELTFEDREKGKTFAEKYKEFYSDIKTNIKEDW